MSAELHDFRGKLTARTHCALEARSRATGRDRAEIVREILDDWAVHEVHAASVLHRLLLGEGMPGIAGGAAGSLGEPEGLARKG